MHRVALILLAIATIAGCTERMEIAQAPVEVQRNTNFVSENYVGNDTATFRSYFAKNEETGEKRSEFSGAACQIKGPGYAARFTTPAIVNLPDYDFYSQPVTGSCTTGETLRPVILTPYNETIRARNAATNAQASQGGLLGMMAVALVSGVANAVNDPTNDDWDYDDVAVEFPASAKPAAP